MIWEYAWNKPLYANTKVEIGKSWVEKLKPHMRGAWHHWGGEGDSVCITKVGKGIRTEAFKAVSPLAQQIRDETGIAMYRLFAIQGAAEALRARAARSRTPYADLVNVDPGVMVPAVQREMGPGWGLITALHFLTDLGLACKPDLNLVRTVRHLGLEVKLRPHKVPKPDRVDSNQPQGSLSGRRAQRLLQSCSASLHGQNIDGDFQAKAHQEQRLEGI